jgi:hypothetical protein
MERKTRIVPASSDRSTAPGLGPFSQYSGAMLDRRWLAAIGTSVALATTLGGPALGAPPAAPPRGRAAEPRAYLIHLIHGGDPIVVQKYVEADGQIKFEKYGGWVAIPKYEVVRIVPDNADDTDTSVPPPAPVEASDAPVYVATRNGAALRATSVGTKGAEVRVSTPEGSLSFRRADLVGVLRVPAPPAPAEAWITIWGSEGASAETKPPGSRPGSRSPAPPTSLTDRPHLLHLGNGTVIQVEGFWIEAGEIRFRRLGGIVGFALDEIARLLPQEVEPVRGRLPARFVRQLGPDRVEVRLSQGLKRVQLIGVEPVAGNGAREDPWATVERGLLLHLEFDRERSLPDGDWLAYVYLPSGRMLNAELIRTGLARPRAETQNIRYLDLFQEIQATR